MRTRSPAWYSKRGEAVVVRHFGDVWPVAPRSYWARGRPWPPLAGFRSEAAYDSFCAVSTGSRRRELAWMVLREVVPTGGCR
jgi:hypothetical protein